MINREERRNQLEEALLKLESEQVNQVILQAAEQHLDPAEIQELKLEALLRLETLLRLEEALLKLDEARVLSTMGLFGRILYKLGWR